MANEVDLEFEVDNVGGLLSTVILIQKPPHGVQANQRRGHAVTWKVRMALAERRCYRQANDFCEALVKHVVGEEQPFSAFVLGQYGGVYLRVFLLFGFRRVTAFEVPAVAAHLLNAVFRFPTEQLLCKCGIAPVGCDVACAARPDGVGNVASARLFKSSNNFKNAVAATASQINGDPARMLHHIGHCFGVAFSEIHHVDVVANTRTVGRIEVIAENAKHRELSVCHARNVRQAVVGYAARIDQTY